LGETFTKKPVKIFAKNIQDAMEGLCSQFGESFKDTILNNGWFITTGARDSEELSDSDNFLTEELINFPLSSSEIHIFPAVGGAGGVGRIILGVVLIIVAVVVTIFAPPAGAAIWGTLGGYAIGGTAVSLALAGVVSIAGGVMALMSKTPTMQGYQNAASGSVDQKLSFIFNGAVNNTEQGVPVPLVYGDHLTGSTVISAGLIVKQL